MHILREIYGGPIPLAKGNCNENAIRGIRSVCFFDLEGLKRGYDYIERAEWELSNERTSADAIFLPTKRTERGEDVSNNRGGTVPGAPTPWRRDALVR